MSPITVKTDTTATFSGTVNPMGGNVSCKFQYSTDQLSWTDLAEPDCATLLNGGGAQAVSQDVTGLLPNTTYYVRLSVSRPFVPNSTVTSFASESSTPTRCRRSSATSARSRSPTPPPAWSARSTRATRATGYVFEYGTTPALGSSTAPLNIGGGTSPITISQVVGGLTPDTTYYFKLAATNDFGTTKSTTRDLPHPHRALAAARQPRL